MAGVDASNTRGCSRCRRQRREKHIQHVSNHHYRRWFRKQKPRCRVLPQRTSRRNDLWVDIPIDSIRHVQKLQSIHKTHRGFFWSCFGNCWCDCWDLAWRVSWVLPLAFAGKFDKEPPRSLRSTQMGKIYFGFLAGIPHGFPANIWNSMGAVIGWLSRNNTLLAGWHLSWSRQMGMGLGWYQVHLRSKDYWTRWKWAQELQIAWHRTRQHFNPGVWPIMREECTSTQQNFWGEPSRIAVDSIRLIIQRSKLQHPYSKELDPFFRPVLADCREFLHGFPYSVVYREMQEALQISDVSRVQIRAVEEQEDTRAENLYPCFKPFGDGEVSLLSKNVLICDRRSTFALKIVIWHWLL